MKKRLALAVVAVLLLAFAYGLGYQRGHSRTNQTVRIAAGKDASDSPQAAAKSGETDPYYWTVNSIPAKVR